MTNYFERLNINIQALAEVEILLFSITHIVFLFFNLFSKKCLEGRVVVRMERLHAAYHAYITWC